MDDKWTEKREIEVRDKVRRPPHGKIFADVLTEAVAKVYMVRGQDGEDMIATLAKELEGDALILSADQGHVPL